MGGGKKPKSPPSSPYETAAADIANKTYAETDPLRQEFLRQMGDFTSGGYDPTKMSIFTPLYNTARAGPEAQYRGAMDSILANTPRGGGQTAAITSAELTRAKDVGSIPAMITSDLLTDMLNKAYGAAFNTPQQSMAGLGSIAQSYGSRAMGYGQNAAFMQKNMFDLMSNFGKGTAMAVGK